MENNHYDILSLSKKHLRDIEDGKAGMELAAYYSEQIEQIEYPNTLNIHGAVSVFNTLIKRSEKGRQIVVSQKYEVHKEFVNGNTVILEVTWTAIMSIPIGKTPAGKELKANFALFIEFENDKIIRQRNYDCFEPF